MLYLRSPSLLFCAFSTLIFFSLLPALTSWFPLLCSLLLSLLLLVNSFPVRRSSICFFNNQNMRNGWMDVVPTSLPWLIAHSHLLDWTLVKKCKMQWIRRQLWMRFQPILSFSCDLSELMCNKGVRLHHMCSLCNSGHGNDPSIQYYLFNAFSSLPQSNICLYMMA